MIALALSLALVAQVEPSALKPGMACRISTDNPTPGAVSLGAYLAYLEVLLAEDRLGAKEMEDEGRLIYLADQTPVKVLKVHAGLDLPAVEGRIQDGKHKGKRLWIPTTSLVRDDPPKP